MRSQKTNCIQSQKLWTNFTSIQFLILRYQQLLNHVLESKHFLSSSWEKIDFICRKRRKSQDRAHRRRKRRSWRKIHLTSSINIIIANTGNRLTFHWMGCNYLLECCIMFQPSTKICGSEVMEHLERDACLCLVGLIDTLSHFDHPNKTAWQTLIHVQLKINCNEFNFKQRGRKKYKF